MNPQLTISGYMSDCSITLNVRRYIPELNIDDSDVRWLEVENCRFRFIEIPMSENSWIYVYTRSPRAIINIKSQSRIVIKRDYSIIGWIEYFAINVARAFRSIDFRRIWNES